LFEKGTGDAAIGQLTDVTKYKMINTTSRPTTRRPPLGEATRRVNNAKQQQQQEHQARYEQKAISYHTNEVAKQTAAIPEFHPQLHGAMQQGSDASNAVNPRLSAIAQEHPASNRNSQISTTSTNSEGKRLKSYIGPWKLGKTLGKGATARVRLARHAVTGQEAAVKIVQKKNAQLSQAGSLAAFDKAESNIPDSGDGLRRMPVGIEREVAIMKLIQHPNIMKLHDIWENRTEM
jgi:serine/threonine-protein kinase HSL1 (negative regulator of Swe1 kinase)